MKRLAVLILFGLAASYLAPVLFTRLDKLPHRHILIGNVTAAEMEAHLAAERAPAPPPTRTPSLQTGVILSVPFGDWTDFFSNLGMCFLVGIGWLGMVAFCARLVSHPPLVLPSALGVADPPPRFV